MTACPPATRTNARSLLRVTGWVAGGFVLLAVAWTVGEARWDARLFAEVPGTTAENLGVSDARALWAGRPGLQVLDVRSAWETSRGVIPGARCIPWGRRTSGNASRAGTAAGPCWCIARVATAAARPSGCSGTWASPRSTICTAG